jgi:hypothetical protein
MRKEKSVSIGDAKFTARELTVKQITVALEAVENNNVTIHEIDMLFPDRMPSNAVAMSLDMTLDELSEYAPSEIESMIGAAEEINPTFAGLLQRLANIGRAALAAKASNEPSAG